MKFLDWLLDLVFPPKCPFCAALQERPGVCPACRADLPWIDEDHVLRYLPGGEACAAPLWYEGKVREGLLRFKFQGASAAAEPLGGMIAQCAAERFSGGFDTVTWVPVSRKRLKKRGYDQARLLAQSAARVWGVRAERLLEKRVDNPAQSSLQSAADRRENVRDVYVPARGAAAEGRRVLLIDDICTTGSTLSACAAVLRAAGCAEVVCAAVAFPRMDDRPAADGKTADEAGKCS